MDGEKKMKKIIALIMVFFAAHTAFSEKLIVTYDSGKVLSGVQLYKDGAEYPLGDGFFAYIYDMETGERTKYSAPEKDNPPAPDIPDKTPGEEPDGETGADKLPTVYEKAKDALSAFAIVTNKSQAMLDDEEVWKTEVLYQGKKREFYIANDVKITSAPDYYGELLEQTAEVLKRGDIINISASLSGRINGIGFIMRLDGYDIIKDDIDCGYDFEHLYSMGGAVRWANEAYPINRFGKTDKAREQYQFGLVCAKKDMYYTITNKAGKAAEMTDILVLPETIVYTCNVGKKYTVAQGSVSDIFPSFIPSQDMDADGNIVNWSDDGYVYALSRTINGIASEVVVFTNLK